MVSNEIDLNKLSGLLTLLVDEVTCIECCKYLKVPKTADCGHTLCHDCWAGRQTCASCGAPVNRKNIKLNLPCQTRTEHTHFLQEDYERIFDLKLDDYLYDVITQKSAEDPTKHIKDWLANSENQFSGPQSSQLSTQGLDNQSHNIESKIQIHSKSSKTIPSENTVHIGIRQDDWDKIEEMPDTENLCQTDKENIIGPMDIEPFSSDQFEFTNKSPRRSSRKRDITSNKVNANNSVDKNSSKKLTTAADSKLVKIKKNWANVKKMKKEFSKLNKKSKNKLNVSIEMCKKSSSIKNISASHVNAIDDPPLNIDENTPHINNTPKCSSPTIIVNSNLGLDTKSNVILNTLKDSQKCKEDQILQTNNILQRTVNKSITENIKSHCEPETPVTFIMRGPLQRNSNKSNNDESCKKNMNNNLDSVRDIRVTTDKVTGTTDDIEITIKIGNTLTNICIKKKDVQLKINTDKEIQTSLDKCIQNNENIVSCSANNEVECQNNVFINIQNNDQNISQNVIKECQKSGLEKCTINNKNVSIVKTTSTKKNTESADTATVNYEITESIEKELSKEMDKVEEENKQSTLGNVKHLDTSKSHAGILDEDCINDLDLFDNDSIKEGYVQSLKSGGHAPSEILVSTIKSNRSRKKIDKRARDDSSDDLSAHKKIKSVHEDANEYEKIINTSKTNQSKNFDQNSELTNFDAIMGQVFANIDADMENLEKNNKNVLSLQLDKTGQYQNSVCNLKQTTHLGDSIQGVSENVFSILEQQNKNSYKENMNQSLSFNHRLSKNTQKVVPSCDIPSEKPDNEIELIDMELSTPVQNNDDSESIVEETPQKSESFSKLKQKNTTNVRTNNTMKNKSLKLKRADSHVNKCDSSIIDLSEVTDVTTKHVTVTEANMPRQTLETPVTVTKFFDQIKYKSTPMARKSLNFDKENGDIIGSDPDHTLCPSTFSAVKTTQEKEFMSKAFEDSPKARSLLKYCLAGSCLTPYEISNIKTLCSLRNWQYEEKYTSELTHLVVSVDEEKKSQRSVKYMRALAAGKWIVSYSWVQMCLQLKNVVDEEPYEALDCTGEPGPRRSRITKQKLFRGITFFCMPPFSVLDIDTLKEMLSDAGGCVVDDAKAVRVTGSSPALLLAEPENTQEDRFIDLAVNLKIVPVNFEWVLNCLGNYSISSVQELLLCPAGLLPPATEHWPQDLMAKEFD